MFKFSYNSEYQSLQNKLSYLQKNIPHLGENWTRHSVNNLYHHINHNLNTQGRSPSGSPPPLSDATKQIYSIRGNPDGSGIREHLRIEYQRQGNRSVAILGILKSGEVVARVQERGAYIKVTPAMRGYLAQYGVFLRADTTYIKIPPRRFWSKANRTAIAQSQVFLQKMFDRLWHYTS